MQTIYMQDSLMREKLYINNIPAIVWGQPSEKVYIYVHGKMSYKETAEEFAIIAEKRGYQTISFDLPEHGERADSNYPCDIWNGMNDLNQIAEYSDSRWKSLSLFTCSLGSHFALYAYKDRKFDYCLFQSPIVDIDYLINQLFRWFHLSEEVLREKGVVETPFHVLTWEYYEFVKQNPVTRWDSPTNILFGTIDNTQSRECVDEFVSRYHCELVVAEGSSHGFAKEIDRPVANQWLEDYIR